jgi:hypothetical protein
MNIRSTFVLGCAIAFVANSAAMGAAPNALPPFVHYTPPVIQHPVIVPRLPNITVVSPRVASPLNSVAVRAPVSILPPLLVNQPPLLINQPPLLVNHPPLIVQGAPNTPVIMPQPLAGPF